MELAPSLTHACIYLAFSYMFYGEDRINAKVITSVVLQGYQLWWSRVTFKKRPQPALKLMFEVCARVCVHESHCLSAVWSPVEKSIRLVV